MTVAVPQSSAQLALDFLFDRLRTETADRLDPPPNVVFGWREAVKQINQGEGRANRVVLQPGDATGKVGDLIGAKLPGRNPPPIGTMLELATIFMWSADLTDLTDARLQWIAVRRLHDVVVPCCIRAFRGRWKQMSKTWVKPETERPFGAEIAMVFAVEAMIPDDLVPEAPGDNFIAPAWTVNGATC